MKCFRHGQKATCPRADYIGCFNQSTSAAWPLTSRHCLRTLSSGSDMCARICCPNSVGRLSQHASALALLRFFKGVVYIGDGTFGTVLRVKKAAGKIYKKFGDGDVRYTQRL